LFGIGVQTYLFGIGVQTYLFGIGVQTYQGDRGLRNALFEGADANACFLGPEWHTSIEIKRCNTQSGRSAGADGFSLYPVYAPF
jgi:hypothetical protein